MPNIFFTPEQWKMLEEKLCSDKEGDGSKMLGDFSQRVTNDKGEQGFYVPEHLRNHVLFSLDQIQGLGKVQVQACERDAELIPGHESQGMPGVEFRAAVFDVPKDPAMGPASAPVAGNSEGRTAHGGSEEPLGQQQSGVFPGRHEHSDYGDSSDFAGSAMRGVPSAWDPVTGTPKSIAATSVLRPCVSRPPQPYSGLDGPLGRC